MTEAGQNESVGSRSKGKIVTTKSGNPMDCPTHPERGREVLTNIVRDSDYPGNQQAFDDLVKSLSQNSVIGFTGAGTSVPLAPAWSQLLATLIGEGVTRGLISASDEAELKQQIEDDPLELAATLEDHFTKDPFRARLSKMFSLDGKYTEIHRALIQIRLSGIVTLNYDDGLESAYAHFEHRIPRVIRPDERFEINRWLHSDSGFGNQLPILHLHGSISSPDRMVLTADDYNSFYSKKENVSVIEELWRSKNIFAVGFGFKDPFLVKLAEGVLRNLPSEAKHFGLIGTRDKSVSALQRRTFARKFRLAPIFYHIDTSGDCENHQHLMEILDFAIEQKDLLAREPGLPMPAAAAMPPAGNESEANKAKRDLDASLFVAPNGTPLYVEPTLREPVKINNSNDNLESSEVYLSDIFGTDQSYIINCRFEYGGTTLSKKIKYEMALANTTCVVRSAKDLPQYKVALQKDEAFKVKSDTLVLDNVDLTRDERLIKEIVGLDIFTQIIILANANGGGLASSEDLGFKIDFKLLTLDQVGRSGIRQLASAMYDTYDADLIGAAVEKNIRRSLRSLRSTYSFQCHNVFARHIQRRFVYASKQTADNGSLY